MFAALCIKGNTNDARVLEGPVPMWKAYGTPDAGNGLGGTDYGLPRFQNAKFLTRFPFGKVTLQDPTLPLNVELNGWSPFIPGDADASSLPVAAVEYSFENVSTSPVECVFSFHARNFMCTGSPGSKVVKFKNGFVLSQADSQDEPHIAGNFSACVDNPETKVNLAWFRGGWYDALTMVWKSIAEGEIIEATEIIEGAPSPGASLYVPLTLSAGEKKTLVLRLMWHVPETNIRIGADEEDNNVDNAADCCDNSCECHNNHKPWYAKIFTSIENVNAYWAKHYTDLRKRTLDFTDCFYDMDLAPELIEAIAANLTILKSPTVQRQEDGKLWCWEGCHDTHGCCHGSCTHVWNYAQAIPHLFPAMERSLRETEFLVDQNAEGHQTFRASLPIRPTTHDFHAAADGQLGGIMKVYREWRICGDEMWLRQLWLQVKQSLDYCIATWDPDHKGALIEPHHNTYDIEFWGPDGMCTSFYLGALKAASLMGKALDDPQPLYDNLLKKGINLMETELWDGEYFIQKIQWEGIRASDPTKNIAWNVSYSPEAIVLLQEEGPKYQYGSGCISDGVLGAWIGAVCGMPEFLDSEKVRSHLCAVHRYNLKKDLSRHANPQRPTFAFGKDGGLLLCTWPKGGALSLPFVYSDEVWTGIEYQVAAHLMLMGQVEEGLEIVSTVRDRYNGITRNPFNEYECGHWYARALASYGMLQCISGTRYDAVDKCLTIKPNIQGDFKVFISTANGYGMTGVRNGEPFVDVKSGTIPIDCIDYTPFEG